MLHTCSLFVASCAIAPTQKTAPPPAYVALCLVAQMDRAGDLAAAAEPAYEATKKKLSDGVTPTVVDLAPLLELTDFVLDLRACVQQAAQR